MATYVWVWLAGVFGSLVPRRGMVEVGPWWLGNLLWCLGLCSWTLMVFGHHHAYFARGFCRF